MTHYQARTELQRGTAPELICGTCPWDRLCVEPPSMSSREIDRAIHEAEVKDGARDPLGQKVPVQMLMTALIYAGKDLSGKLCPVFVARLRGPSGRRLADEMRATMQRWGEP